jgi:hypothetical protein
VLPLPLPPATTPILPLTTRGRAALAETGEQMNIDEGSTATEEHASAPTEEQLPVLQVTVTRTGSN